MSVYIGGTKVAGLEKELPAQTGNAGKYLYTDGQNASWEEASTAQIWIGTQAEYEALGTYDPEVVYQVTDDFQNLIPNVGQITEDVNDLKAHAVVEFQVPTAANNYTWYRKYADGWVEQGGVSSPVSAGNHSVTLAVKMADSNYQIMSAVKNSTNNGAVMTFQVRTVTTTTFSAYAVYYASGAGAAGEDWWWEVKGMAA